MLHISRSSTNRENCMACQGGHGKELRIRVSKGKLLCPEDMVSFKAVILYDFQFFDKVFHQSYLQSTSTIAILPSASVLPTLSLT